MGECLTQARSVHSKKHFYLCTLQAKISRANGKDLHERFPKLRIVLEHCSTTAALDAVWNCGPSVVGSFCLLPLTVIVGQRCFHQGRMRWRSEIHSVSCNWYFVLTYPTVSGSDSAPHPLISKQTLAGVFTQPFITQLVLLAFEKAITRGIIGENEVTQERHEQFLKSIWKMFLQVAST